MVKENIMTKNEIDSESGSFVNKVYDLLIKELIEAQNEDESNSKNKKILNFIKLLEISVNADETKKYEILLEQDKTH